MNPVNRGSYVETLFSLCREFHCLPSQIEQEESDIIEKFIVLLDEIRRKEEEEYNKIKKERALSILR
jgi:hypothetical protein